MKRKPVIAEAALTCREWFDALVLRYPDRFGGLDSLEPATNITVSWLLDNETGVLLVKVRRE